MLNGGRFFFSLSCCLILTAAAEPPGPVLELTGNTFFSTTYLTAGHHPGGDRSDIERFIIHVLDCYHNAGFPFCRIRPQTAAAPAVITLEIDEGQRIVIDDLRCRVRGSTDTRALHRYLHPTRGRYFSGREVSRLRHRLEDTGLFREIKDLVIHEGDRYFLYLDMTENRHDQFSAGASLNRSQVAISAEIAARNLLGTLRQFLARYEYQRAFDLTYQDPVLIAPVTLQADVSLLTVEKARRTQLKARLSAPLGFATEFSLMSGREIVAYVDTSGAGYAHTLLGAGLNQTIEIQPVAFEWSAHFEHLFRDRDRLRVDLDGACSAYDLHVRPHAAWSITSRHEYFDYVRIGGARTVRGYLEDEIVATSAWWANIEYKPLFIYPLCDIAYANHAWLYAVGVGLDATTALGETSLVFAWPKDGTWRDGKVHVSLMKNF